MVKSLRRLLVQVNHALVATIFNVANIHKNKILAKISEFTVLAFNCQSIQFDYEMDNLSR